MRRRHGFTRRDVVVTSAVGGALAIAGGFAADAATRSTVQSVAVGGRDVTGQLQRALDRIPRGGSGRIVVRPGVHRISRTVTANRKTVTLVFEGTLKDAVRSWKADFTSDRLDDKGLLAFRDCTVTLRGSATKHYHLDGSAGESGLAAEGRTLLFFDRCRLDISDLWTSNSSGATLQAFSTRGATYQRCRHDRAGQYGVFFLGGRDISIDRVRIRDSVLGALSVNRTGWGRAAERPQRVTITNCDVRRFSATDNYAGGIVVNDGDHIRATGNISDGAGQASFAYSFGGCTDVYSRNTALNMSNNRVGTYDYAGIAFELDGTVDGDFDDVMTNCLGGYLLANNRDLRLAGEYHCDAGRSRRLDSGAGKTGMFMIANTQRISRSIVIDGARCDGGNSFMTGAMRIDDLAIRNVTVRDTFYSIFNFEGGVVRGLTVANLDYRDPGRAPAPVIEAAGGVLRGISVDGAKAESAVPSSASGFYSADSAGQSLRFSGLRLQNLAVGVDTRWSGTKSLTILDSTFDDVPAPVASVSARTRTVFLGNKRNGASARSLKPAR